MATGHFLTWRGERTEVEAFLVRDYAREGHSGWHWHRFESAETAARFIAGSNMRSLVRLGAVYDGRQHHACPREAIDPVYDALDAAAQSVGAAPA